ELFGYGLSYAGSNVTGTFSTQYDRVILSQAVPSAALGQYAVAGTVAGLSAPLATAIASVFFPRLSDEDMDQQRRRGLEVRAILMALGSTTVVIVVLALVAVPFVP